MKKQKNKKKLNKTQTPDLQTTVKFGSELCKEPEDLEPVGVESQSPLMVADERHD